MPTMEQMRRHPEAYSQAFEEIERFKRYGGNTREIGIPPEVVDILAARKIQRDKLDEIPW